MFGHSRLCDTQFDSRFTKALIVNNGIKHFEPKIKNHITTIESRIIVFVSPI